MAKTHGLENLGGAVIDKEIRDYIKTKLDLEKAFDLLEELQDFFEGNGYEFWCTVQKRQGDHEPL